MVASGKIKGIFTPNMVPLDDRGQINEAELRRYVDWMIERGVHGLYPNGSTSEFVRFTAAERRRIIEVVVDQTAGRVPVLAGAAEANVRETLGACEYYHRLGVRAVAIVAPFYYKLSPDNVYAYFREIGRHTPVDVTLYNIPMFASPIDVATVQRLSEECPRIVAIKDSSGDMAQMIRLIRAVRPNRPDFSFLSGWEAALVPMLLAGCDGGTHASSGVVPELTRQVYDAATGGRLDEAWQLQGRLQRLFDPMVSAVDFPEGFRVGVSLRGFRMGASRQPMSNKHRAALAQLEKTLARLLAEEPLVGGRPAAPATSDVDSRQIASIVEGVLAALARQGVALSGTR